MSKYDGDPRVRSGPDGTVTVPGQIDGDWRVERHAGFWTGWNAQFGYLHDATDSRYTARYDTCDQVLEHLLGPAQVSA